MNYQVNESGSHQRKLFQRGCLPDQVPRLNGSLNRLRMTRKESFTAQLENPVTTGRG